MTSKATYILVDGRFWEDLRIALAKLERIDATGLTKIRVDDAIERLRACLQQRDNQL